MVIRYAFPDIHDVRNTRTCRKCGETKSIIEFAWRKDTQNYASRCCACEAVRMADYRRQRTRKAGAGWTDEKNRQLLVFILAGYGRDEASTALGMSADAISSQRWRMSFPRFPRAGGAVPGTRATWTPERIAKLKKLRDARMSFTQCAAILGTTRNAIAHGTRYLREARP